MVVTVVPLDEIVCLDLTIHLLGIDLYLSLCEKT